MRFKASFRVPGVQKSEEIRIIESESKSDALLTFVDYIHQNKGCEVNTTHTLLKRLGFSDEEIEVLRGSGLTNIDTGVTINGLVPYTIAPGKGSKVL